LSQWDILLRELRKAQAGYLLAGGTALVGPGGEAQKADILVSPDGRFERIGDSAAVPSDFPRIDVSGLTIAPGFVDAHQHLDKTGAVAPNPSGTLQGGRDAFAAFARSVTPGDVSARAARTMTRCLNRGLSGGNQQKFVVARELARHPDLLLVNQLTRGIDIGASELVMQAVLEQRDLNKAILLISTELEELFTLCDRILVIYEGRLVGELPPDRDRLEELGLLMAGDVPEARRLREAGADAISSDARR
jgi:hypothetical protein